MGLWARGHGDQVLPTRLGAQRGMYVSQRMTQSLRSQGRPDKHIRVGL